MHRAPTDSRASRKHAVRQTATAPRTSTVALHNNVCSHTQATHSDVVHSARAVLRSHVGTRCVCSRSVMIASQLAGFRRTTCEYSTNIFPCSWRRLLLAEADDPMSYIAAHIQYVSTKVGFNLGNVSSPLARRCVRRQTPPAQLTAMSLPLEL